MTARGSSPALRIGDLGGTTASRAFYNEVDPFAAAWLRELIAQGHIAPGVVDERPIQEVQPSDVEGYTQAHFFAGIGGWSLALRLAGWPDTAAAWTGSCPCRPFSASGRRRGFDDERHLWPEFYRLIRECRPAVVFGEQVASPDGLGWYDVVHPDLEDALYAVGEADLCSAGVGAPNLRQRLFFVAESVGDRHEERSVHVRERRPLAAEPSPARRGAAGVADSASPGRHGGSNAGAVGGSARKGEGEGDQSSREIKLERGRVAGPCGCWDPDAWHRTRGFAPGEVCVNAGVALGDASGARVGRHCGTAHRTKTEGAGQGVNHRPVAYEPEPSGVTRGFWGGAAWIPCKDGRMRPVEPGSFPLAPRIPARLGRGKSSLGGMARGNRHGRLRGYGNAINPHVAAEFIGAYLDVVRDRETA